MRRIRAEAARQQLHGALDRMVQFIVARPEAGEIVQFLLRELSHPTAALDRIYAGVFEPLHRRLCAIWEAATGEAAESDGTKLTVFTLIGQVIYFRIGQEAVKRRMGWAAIGAGGGRRGGRRGQGQSCRDAGLPRNDGRRRTKQP